MQHGTPNLQDEDDIGIREWKRFFQADKFDVRKRSYETEETYRQRLVVATIAHQTDYRSDAWEPLEIWVDICPTGYANRFNHTSPQFAECYYLEMKHVTIEDWLIPEGIPFKATKELSRRAGHIPHPGDVLLSRFKEPLGKSLIYEGNPVPLVANTNFLLLRPKPDISSFFVLGVLKSSFLARQLHIIIQRKALIAEMSQEEARLIRFPKLPSSMQTLIADSVEQRVSLQHTYHQLINREQQDSTDAANMLEIKHVLSSADLFIDEVISSFLGVTASAIADTR
jgi:hypothetical protein